MTGAAVRLTGAMAKHPQRTAGWHLLVGQSGRLCTVTAGERQHRHLLHPPTFHHPPRLCLYVCMFAYTPYGCSGWSYFYGMYSLHVCRMCHYVPYARGLSGAALAAPPLAGGVR